MLPHEGLLLLQWTNVPLVEGSNETHERLGMLVTDGMLVAPWGQADTRMPLHAHGVSDQLGETGDSVTAACCELGSLDQISSVSGVMCAFRRDKSVLV